MKGVVLVLLLLVGGFIVAKRAGLLGRLGDRTDGSSRQDWPVYARRVLSPNEQKLFHRLCAAFPGRVVLAQVSLSQLLGVKKGQGKNYQSILNRFRLLTADFVVCNKDFSVAAVFELDDNSHDNPKRQSSDSRKAAALAAAAIPLHRLNAARIPDEADLQQLQMSSGRSQNV